ncbi:MAG: hypothetical protein AB7F28_01970 [Candidatus Margulisiibacteriota bacterium]
MTRLSQIDIADRIPHRFENLVLDAVEMEEIEGVPGGTLALTIGNPDAQGRHIFSKKITPTTSVFLTTAFMEVLALASIVTTGRLLPGQMTYFSGISNFECTGSIPLGTRMVGTVRKVKSKGEFMFYTGTIENEAGQTVAKGDMSAIFMQAPTPEEAAKAVKKKVEVYPQTQSKAIDKSVFHKDKAMVMVDAWVHETESESVFAYHFPETHPLCRGHFPGNPVMMGIMQWMIVEDAGLILAQNRVSQGHPFPETISLQAEIIKEDGVLVADLRGIEVACTPETQDQFATTTVSKTQKITFRDFVKPGETLLIKLSNIAYA